MKILSVSLIIIYLLAVKIIAAKACRNSPKNSEEYFAAGRSLGGFLLWATILATVINSLAFTAVPGLVYKGGLLFLQMWVIVCVLPICIRAFGPKVATYAREHNVLSQGELFGIHYNSDLIKICTASIAFFAVLPFMTIQLSAIAKVVSVATDGYLPYGASLLFFAVFTGGYLYLGGARAVVVTDLVQGACFFLLLLVSALLFNSWVGGFDVAFDRIYEKAPHLFSLEGKRQQIFIDNILSWPFAFFLWPQVFQRLFMAKSEAEVKRSSGATFVLFASCMALIMTMGIMCAATFLGTSMDSDTLVAEMYKKYFPLGGAFIVLAVVASAMSTLDSGLLALSSVFCRDILSARDDSEKTSHTARNVSVLLLVVVSVFAWTDTGRGAMVPLVTFGASAATLMLWPLIGMRFFPSYPRIGVYLSYAFGATGIVVAAFTHIFPFGAGTAGFVFGFIGFTLGVFLGRIKE